MIDRSASGYNVDMNSQPDSQPEPRSGSDTEGQVSEVASFGVPGETISPGDSVAGAPDGESGRADEGRRGLTPSLTNDNRRDVHPDKGDVETTG
jgi:hypothetical protein